MAIEKRPVLRPETLLPHKPPTSIIGSVRSSFPVDGAAALGFQQAFFEVHRARNDAASDLLLFQGGVMCHCVIANLVV